MSHCSFNKPKVAIRNCLYTMFQQECHVRLALTASFITHISPVRNITRVGALQVYSNEAHPLHTRTPHFQVYRFLQELGSLGDVVALEVDPTSRVLTSLEPPAAKKSPID